MNTPEHLLQKIRQREGLKKDDTSEDDRIEKMSPLRKFRRVMGWEFGSDYWADRALEWAKDCGYKIPEE